MTVSKIPQGSKKYDGHTPPLQRELHVALFLVQTYA